MLLGVRVMLAPWAQRKTLRGFNGAWTGGELVGTDGTAGRWR